MDIGNVPCRALQWLVPYWRLIAPYKPSRQRCNGQIRTEACPISGSLRGPARTRSRDQNCSISRTIPSMTPLRVFSVTFFPFGATDEFMNIQLKHAGIAAVRLPVPASQTIAICDIGGNLLIIKLKQPVIRRQQIIPPRASLEFANVVEYIDVVLQKRKVPPPSRFAVSACGWSGTVVLTVG